MNEIVKKIRENKSFEIITHERPDGDAAASESALALLLRYLGKDVKIIDIDDFPEIYKFLIKNWKNAELKKADCTFFLDCGEKNRITEHYKKKIIGNCIINIDHHTDNSGYGDYNLVLPEYSSTAEILYYLFRRFNIKEGQINKNFFKSIYTGISTDTGNLSFSNADSRTFRTVSDLMNVLGNPRDIYKKIYCSKKANKVKLTGEVLRRIETFFDNKLVISYVKKNDFDNYNLSHSELEGIVDYLGEIKNAEVYILVKQLGENISRLSLRSTGNISVLDFAKNNSGGGHSFAAGATINNNLNETKKIIKDYWSRKL